MTDQEINIAIAEACGHQWYWSVCGNGPMGFQWKAQLAFPPEEGVGKAWIGQAGETKPLTVGEIELGKLRDTVFRQTKELCIGVSSHDWEVEGIG